MAQLLVTRGLGGTVAQLIVRGFVLSGATPTTPADLYAAIAEVLLSDGTLETAFGRADWFWLDLAPPGEPLPVAVLSHVSATTEAEPAETSGNRSRVETRTFQIQVFDDDRDNAATLADAVAAAIEAAARAGTLTHSRGTTIDAARDGVELDSLDPDPAPNGSDVWGRTVQLQGMISRS